MRYLYRFTVQAEVEVEVDTEFGIDVPDDEEERQEWAYGEAVRLGVERTNEVAVRTNGAAIYLDIEGVGGEEVD